jgi:ankyrin repeat protein
MLAAYHGHAPLVRLLIQHGADPNKVNDRGQTPLAGAVFKGESEVVEVSYPYPRDTPEKYFVDYARHYWKATRTQIMELPVLWKRWLYSSRKRNGGGSLRLLQEGERLFPHKGFALQIIRVKADFCF